MLEDTVVFILSNAKYDAPIESTGYTIAKHLAKRNKIFYVEYPATVRDYYRFKSSPSFNKKKELFSRSSNGLLKSEIPNLTIVITRLLLSINFLPEGWLYRKLLNYNEKLIVKRIKKVIHSEGIKDFIFINSFNIHYPNVGEMLNPALNAYHCVDPLVSGYDTKHGLISEQLLIESSDLVICTSKELFKLKSELHKQTYFVPNAADFSHSSKASLAGTPILPALASIKKPIIGFLGNIEGRMDFDLVISLAKAHVDKSFVFVGPISDFYREKLTNKRDNIHLIDGVPYSEMPQVLKGFDIAIIPFRKDEVSATIFPLKLFEYLGSGKPVISTNFNPDLKEQTDDTVPYCENIECFSMAIDEALANDTEEKKQARLIVAQNNTWDKRAAEFANLLAKHLRIKLQ